MKKIVLFITMAVFFQAGIGMMAEAAAPSITINGAIDMSTRQDAHLVLRVNLEAGTDAGKQADWFGAAFDNTGRSFYYDLAAESWKIYHGDNPPASYQGHIFDLKSMPISLRGLDLHATEIKFAFGVDLNRDGFVSWDSLVYKTARLRFVNDCRIVSIRQIADYGMVGHFSIHPDFSGLPDGTPFFQGQKGPDSTWIYYPVDNDGLVNFI